MRRRNPAHNHSLDTCGCLKNLVFSYQALLEADAKLARVTRSRILAVAVDRRPDSRTFCRSLTCTFLPRGWDYVLSSRRERFRAPDVTGRGRADLSDVGPRSAGPRAWVRWNDPALGIRWKVPPSCVPVRDAALPEPNEIVPAFQPWRCCVPPSQSHFCPN
jgi:dTDP-4-dehydrorhamnose 3,5-epimerase